MSLKETMLENGVIDIANDEISISKKAVSVTNYNKIPETAKIPIENPSSWLKIPNVICVYVDMIGSTKLSAEEHEKTTAKSYRLFTNTLVRIFDYYESPDIDIKGDGVFALFNSNNPYKAVVAAVTAKTIVETVIDPEIKNVTGNTHGAHIGIDQSTVLVRKLGFKRFADRTDRQNEVWAGKTVNMAVKLSSMTKAGEMLVSDRFFKNIQNDLVLKSCGCGSADDQPVNLWEKVELSDDKFDFDIAYRLKSRWCEVHGLEYIKKILKLDKE